MTELGQSQMDHNRFVQLFEQYKKRIYGYLLAITHSSYAAEEITQEIFIKLWMRRDSLAGIENLDGYIFTIARNKAINHFKKATLDRRLIYAMQQQMNAGANITEEQAMEADCRRSLQNGVALLSPQRRIVYQLSRNQGLDFQEIAAQLQLSRSTVKNHLVEALKFLRKYLNYRYTLLIILLTARIF